MTRTEKAKIAAQMRADGMKLREIAAELGISKSTASALILDPTRAKRKAYLKAHQGECIDCGAPTQVGKNGSLPSKRCRSCSRKHRSENAIWTREVIIEAIRLYADRYGHPPSARDWNPSMARNDYRDDIAERFYEDGCWPATTGVQKVFGSWNAAIRAAGFRPLKAGHKYADADPFAPTRPHGSISRYLDGCRCDTCRDRSRAMWRARYHARKTRTAA